MADTADGRRAELAATVALAQVQGIGSARLGTLRRAFGSTHAGLLAPFGAIRALPGWSPAAATAVRGVSLDDGTRILAELDRLGARALLPDDPEFPPLLREIRDPPAVLYVWGHAEQLSRPAAAMVGSRDPSPYGVAAARLLAAGVARGAVVVSGMARGIDALAHEAALDAGGGSVGVLGNGFGVIYPAANRALYERMVAEGCLVTELPPGERPHAGAFPRRNRVIAGLARATVVVEAAQGSGALITAEFALDEGREVLAVPGPITSGTSVGTNRLIQQGATPALSPVDILERVGVPIPNELRSEHKARSTKTVPRVPPNDLSSLQRSLWDSLARSSQHVDVLAEAAGAPTPAVLTALTELELRGLVASRGVMIFELTAER